MTRLVANSRTILIAFVGLSASLLLSACSDDSDSPATTPTNDVSAGICTEGADDCHDGPTVSPTVAAGPTAVPTTTPVLALCADPASCRERSTDIAGRDLASQLGVTVDTIVVVSAEPVVWPDACLGAGTSGTICAQVITPGFKIILKADGKQYEYHTNEGSRAVLLH